MAEPPQHSCRQEAAPRRIGARSNTGRSPARRSLYGGLACNQMAMGTPSRAQASPPFTPSPSNVVQRRSIELKVAQSLAALPSPSDFESWAEPHRLPAATVAEPGADTPHDHGSSGSDAGDDMLQYLGAGSDVSTDDEDGAEVFDVGTLAESGPADTNAPAGTGARRK